MYLLLKEQHGIERTIGQFKNINQVKIYFIIQEISSEMFPHGLQWLNW